MEKQELREICRMTFFAVNCPSFSIFRNRLGAKEFSLFITLETLKGWQLESSHLLIF